LTWRPGNRSNGKWNADFVKMTENKGMTACYDTEGRHIDSRMTVAQSAVPTKVINHLDAEYHGSRMRAPSSFKINFARDQNPLNFANSVIKHNVDRMGITDRKLRQKEEIRSNILDTAWELVLNEGWSSFSIRKIADAIEYSVPVIYSHFENKEAILLEFNKKGFELLTRSLVEAKKGQPGPADEIRAMARAYWHFAFDNKEYYQLMFGLGIPTCEQASRIPALTDFREVIQQSIHGMLAGLPPSFDPFLKFQSLWSMLHGLVSINMAAVNRQPHEGLAEKVLEDVIDSFIRGIVIELN
jgi:AcrR family transcriptional regulator